MTKQIVWIAVVIGVMALIISHANPPGSVVVAGTPTPYVMPTPDPSCVAQLPSYAQELARDGDLHSCQILTPAP